MTTAPDPTEIFERAVDEGERRLNQTTVELVATSFIAGFTVVLGIAALGITHAAVEPHSAKLHAWRARSRSAFRWSFW